MSVDGDFNLVPDLRPRVQRSEVAAAVDAFCIICSQEHPDGEDYAEARQRVENYAFYLDDDQCERVTHADEREQKRRLAENGIATSALAIRPHPEMDDSYFL